MTGSRNQDDRDRLRRRRLAASLSGGLVIGVGVASTLAGWNTDEYVAAGFTPQAATRTPGPATTPTLPVPAAVPAGQTSTGPSPTASPTSGSTTSQPTVAPSPQPPPEPGTFLLVGSTNAVTYTDHASASSAAMLDFSERAARLSPGEGVAAPFALRLSRVGEGVGQVTMVASVSGSGSDLSYGVYTTASFGCRMGSAVATTLIPAGTPLSGTATSIPVPMPAPAAGSTEGDPVYLCIKVKAAKSLAPGSKHRASWHFAADAV